MLRVVTNNLDRDGRNHGGPLRRIEAFDVLTAVAAEFAAIKGGVCVLFQGILPYCLYVTPRYVAWAIQRERPPRTVGYRGEVGQPARKFLRFPFRGLALGGQPSVNSDRRTCQDANDKYYSQRLDKSITATGKRGTPALRVPLCIRNHTTLLSPAYPARKL